MLQPGDILYDVKGKNSATVRADGSVKGCNTEGSIHQVGAAAQNAAACNGWEYWYYKDKKKGMICIDELRQQIRTEMYGAE
jgi:modification methylase